MGLSQVLLKMCIFGLNYTVDQLSHRSHQACSSYLRGLNVLVLLDMCSRKGGGANICLQNYF